MTKRTFARLAMRGLRACCACAATLCLAISCLAAPSEDEPRWNVVLVRGWDAQYPINLTREQAMLLALTDNAPRLVELYYEGVDTLRFPGDFEAEQLPLMRRKYSDRPIHLVIASGLEAYGFVERHRDDLWPGAPVLFYGVDEGMLDPSRLPPHTTGVTLSMDLHGTLELAQALEPHAQNVYFISGTSDFDKRYLARAKEAVKPFMPHLEPHYIDGLSRDDTVAEVRKIEADSIVVYLSMLRDGTGQFSVPSSSMVTRVSEASRAPVYSAAHSQYSRGPVGGSTSRLDAHGRSAGVLARRILQGADAEAIPAHTEPPPECMVDGRALDRWGIAVSHVPGRCQVMFGLGDSARRYAWPIAGLVIIVVLETILIWALVVQRRQRRIAEAEAHQRRTEMNHAARLAMGGVLTAGIAHEINQPLGAIMGNADAAAIILRSDTPDLAELREIIDEIRAEDSRASEVVRKLRAMLSRREMQPVLLDVNAETAEALHHVSYDVARHDVRLTPAFSPELPPVVGDSIHIQQVVVNLVMNAVEALQAMPIMQRDIRVETAPRNGGAEISVIDSGPGVAEVHRDSLFEAFFTTKEMGMGLGLSIVRAIVEAHRGRVSVEPGPMRGTIFRVWLPAAGS
jgi:signal transduction histidine kinase